MRPTVSATYVVKNEEEYLPFSIRSIHDAVDEIVVVDNGSTDRTVEIAASFPKVRLLRSDAQNFAALRNLAIAHSSGDWFIKIDADEVFYEDFADALPRLVRNPHVDAYTCWFYHLMRSYWYAQNASDDDPTYRRIFLVRKVPGVRYAGAVHERLVGIGSNIVDSGLHYVHYGYAKPKAHVFARWKLYARLEGDEHRYDGTDPESILEDRPLRPFTRGHPAVIRDYVERRAVELAASGLPLFRKPGG